MVNPGTFRGRRLQFLNAQNDDYAAAVESGDVDAFVQNTQRRYFKRFPITLNHDEEPTQEFLDKVDDNAPEDEIKAPDPEGMSAEDYALALTSYNTLVANLKKRKESIKRRLQYRYATTRNDGTATAKGTINSLTVLTAKLMGKTPSKPRLKTPYNLWGPQHRAITDPVFHARVKEGDVPASQQLALRSSVYKELFEELPVAEQEEWTDRAEEEHQNALAEHKKAMAGPPSTKPEDRQRVITAVPKLIAPILDLVASYTGWQWSLMGGGPEPADDGRLNMLSIHSGVMPGTVRMDFGRAERQAYREYIQPTFGRYLTRCYTVEECRSRALPRNHVEATLATVAEEEDFDHRHFDREEQVKVALSKPHLDRARNSKDPDDSAKNAHAATGKDARSTGTSSNKTSNTATRGSGGTNGTTNTSNNRQNTDTASTSIKIGPPRGKKRQLRIPPEGAKDKELAPRPAAGADPAPIKIGPPRGKKPQPKAPVVSESENTEPVPPTPDAEQVEEAGTEAVMLKRAATTSRSLSQPIPPTPALALTSDLFAATRRTTSQPVNPSKVSLGAGTLASWRVRPTSARSMSMAPSRAGSQAPSLGRTPPHSRAPSRGPSLPPSRAPSQGPSLPPSRAPSRAPSPPPSRAPSRGPSPPPSRGPSPPPSRGMSPPPAHALSRKSSPARSCAPSHEPPLAPLRAPSCSISPPPSRAPSRGPSPHLHASVTAPNTKQSGAARRIPSGATAVPDDETLDTMDDVMSGKRRGRGGVVATLKQSAGVPKRKAPVEASGTARKKARGTGGTPIFPKAFDVSLPSDCPEWIENAVKLLAAEDLGVEWRILVRAWLRFEEGFEYAKAGPTLPSQQRPSGITEWIARARKPHYRPNLGKLQDYRLSFWKWWRSLQPAWRSDEDEDGRAITESTLKQGDGEDWSELSFSGQNGILSVVAGLCFWGMAAAGSSNDVKQWLEAVADVNYAFSQLLT